MARLLSTVLFCAVAAIGFAQAAGDLAAKKTTLIALERMWNQAQLDRDAKAIATMIGDRFVNTEFNGEVSNRSKFLTDFADPKFQPSVMSVQNLEVNFYGNTAIVTGDYHTKGIYAGRPYEHFGRFTDTWVFQDAKWLCVASHSSLRLGSG